MKKVDAALTLGLVALFSCSSSIPNKPITLTNKQDNSLSYLYRNGDINSSISSLSELTRPISSAEAINLIETNEAFLLYLYQSNCKHCQDIKDSLIYFLQETSLCMYAVSNSSIAPFCNALNSSYPSLGLDSSKIGTPFGTLIQGSAATSLDMSDKAYSPYVFGDYINSKANVTNLYTFRSAASFVEFMGNNPSALGYLSFNSSALRGALREKAKKVAGSIAMFEGEYAEEKEAMSLKEKGYQEDTLVYLGNSYSSASIEAKSIIENFN